LCAVVGAARVLLLLLLVLRAFAPAPEQ